MNRVQRAACKVRAPLVFAKWKVNMKKSRWVAVGAKVCGKLQISVYNGADVFSFTFPSFARMAELADAVDSKSTDESLVGSTPTPGTILRDQFGGRAGQKMGVKLYVRLGVSDLLDMLLVPA